ncbi:MAG: heme-binding protein [Chitinophagaceae bacterium]|nr:heme-binding protein [Chitinophagaceae bacterium]
MTMKIALIGMGITVVLFIVFQIYITMTTNKAETQLYQLIQAEKDFEIRFYPSSTMAVITSSAKTYRELGKVGFAKLAAYIFGGNKDKMQIAMTSPVHMDIGDGLSSMSFAMPAKYNRSNLPVPDNADVRIVSSPDEFVAAITFDGFPSQEVIEKQTALLKNALNERHLSFYGPFRFLGYNPPYQLAGRRNEIIVALNWAGDRPEEERKVGHADSL